MTPSSFPDSVCATEPHHPYRLARSLPFELREHCIIYFEEGLYSQALTLLTNLLVAATSRSNLVPAFVPSPSIISFVATLSVHPSLTTLASSTEKVAAANQALYLLSHINHQAGPVNANFVAAFAFAEKADLRETRRNARLQNGGSEEGGASPASSGEEDIINTKLAQEDSLWARAEGFWHLVGWAFNCSVKHQGRWERWKLLLDFLLGALEADLTERLRSDMHSPGDGSQKIHSVPDSLVMQYLGNATTAGRTGRRKIMRAIFASGNDKDLTEFKQIFRNETRERKQDQLDVNAVRKKINIDEGEFGDYYEDDDDDGPEIKFEIRDEPGLRSSTRVSRAVTRATPDFDGDLDMGDTEPAVMEPIETYGGVDAIYTRRRILVLLTTVSAALPVVFTSLEEMFDIFTEFVRPLPFAIFALFILPTGPYIFPPAIHSSFLKMLLRPLLAINAPRHEDNYVDQEILEHYYLPFAASSTSVVDNAKVSLLLETLLRLLKGHATLRVTHTLKEAVARGVHARTAKAMPDARRKNQAGKREEAEASTWLATSVQRLNMILSIIEVG